MAGGFKNPFRLSFDRATGDIYLGDVGNNGREEIDFIKSGTLGSQTLARNFGWPVKEGLLDPPAGVTVGSSFDYSNPDAAVPMIDPIQEHHHLGDNTVDPSLRDNTIIGGLVYHGPIASLDGKYIYGDYTTNHLYTANFDRNTLPSAFNGANLTNLQEVSAQWESLIAGGDPAHLDLEFPVHFAEDSQGNLYLVSFGNSPDRQPSRGALSAAVRALASAKFMNSFAVPEPPAGFSHSQRYRLSCWGGSPHRNAEKVPGTDRASFVEHEWPRNRIGIDRFAWKPGSRS